MTLERAKALRSRGWSPILVAPDGEFLRCAKADNIRVLAAMMAKTSPGKVLTEQRPALVHLVSYGGLTREYAFAARRLRIPLVLTVSALQFPGGHRSRRFVRHATMVMAASDSVARDLTARAGKLSNLVTVLDVPLTIDDRAPARSPFSERRSEEPVIGWVGRLDPIKRLEDAIRAFAHLKDVVPGAQLRVAALSANYTPSDGSSYEDFIESELRASGVREAIELSVTEDVFTFLDDTDIFLLTSERESFSRATFEAMTMGRPVVATRAGALTDLVRDDAEGVLVDVGDVSGLATALIDLSLDPGRARRLGAAARARAELLAREYGSVDRIIDVYVRAIEQCQSSSSGSRALTHLLRSHAE